MKSSANKKTKIEMYKVKNNENYVYKQNTCNIKLDNILYMEESNKPEKSKNMLFCLDTDKNVNNQELF